MAMDAGTLRARLRAWVAASFVPAPDSLVVRGCVLGGLICDDDTWTRR